MRRFGYFVLEFSCGFYLEDKIKLLEKRILCKIADCIGTPGYHNIYENKKQARCSGEHTPVFNLQFTKKIMGSKK